MNKILTKKIVLINCYFGKLPTYFDLFLQSCEYNQNIDFLFITDQLSENLPANVKFVYYTFEEYRAYIQSKFDFEIALKTPYKLCDYKPAYGYLLKEYIYGYDFWGHIDVDLIPGKISNFIFDDILDNYEKIYQLGHLCIYKNDEVVNRRFMNEVGMNYKKVFNTDVICVFDEMIGMQNKYNLMNIPTYKSRDMIDIASKYYTFRRVDSWISEEEKKINNYKYQTFYWENGSIYRAAIVNGEIDIREFIYIHFPKRKMIKQGICADKSSYFITNEGFVAKLSGFVNSESIKKTNNRNFLLNIKWLIKDYIYKWERRFKKYFLRR